jgi:hypothetical protein
MNIDDPIRNFLALWALTNGDKAIEDLNPMREVGTAHTFWYCLQQELIVRETKDIYRQITRYVLSDKGRKYLEQS